MVQRAVIECLETTVVARLAGINRSTLDYWVRTGLVTPSLRLNPGKRRTRLWTVQDAVVVRAVAELRASGCPLQQVRKAHDQLRGDWAAIGPETTLLWTGGDVIRLGAEGEAESLVRQPRQQVLRLVELPLGRWRTETARSVRYIRKNNLERGVPAATHQAALAQ
jgi:DNA-binding transcriptional MerR regulator